ncbi:hypothetical protein [Spiroplasma apis]|uniref:Uncharacterized protein n=1 Tax=Spiroplasma apis B31 TaxID=1276258 RepID=V5RJ25_SPIAP|nr:hypothetical protein [Spiroplasma apis]AHB36096.1 hypothetical protein SAPIS_v1c02500 [Spiroplasma apis B31]
MRELTIHEKHQIRGGAGVSGSLFGGIASIISSVTSFVEDMYSDIVSTVFLFNHANDYDKLDMKIGKNTIKLDNTSSNKLSLEHKNQVVDHTLPLF